MKNSNNNNRRQRSRGNGRRFPNQRGNSFESSGPEAKVRGSAQQVLDKYQSLARDAFSAGDRILAEGYLQHAEHYYRIINAEGAKDGSRDNNNRGQQQNCNNNGADRDDDNSAEDSDQSAASEPGQENVKATDDAEAPQQTSDEAPEAPKRKPRQRRPRKDEPVKNADANSTADQSSAAD